jgi:hypothetical protein
MMNCAEFETRLNQLLDDRQTPSDDAQLFHHARECVACRQLLLQLQTMAEVSNYLGATRSVPHERHQSPCWRRGAEGERAACRQRAETSRWRDEDAGVDSVSGDGGASMAPELADAGHSLSGFSAGSWAGDELVGGELRRVAGLTSGGSRSAAISWWRGLAGQVGQPLLLVCLILSVVVGMERAVTRWEPRGGVAAVAGNSARSTVARGLANSSAREQPELAAIDLGPQRAARVMEVVVYDPLFVWPKRAMRVAGQLPAAPTRAWDVRAWVEPTTWVEPVAEQLVSERLTELRTEPWQLVEGWATGMRPLAASMTAALEDWIDVWVPPLRGEVERGQPLESDQWDWRWDLTA